jgi:hypothetical protein
MANNITIELDIEKISRELFELVDNAYKEKPNPKDIRVLQKKLEEVPDLWRAIFDITKIIQSNLIEKAISHKAARIAVEKNVSVLLDEFAYKSSSPLEKLLIDNIVITWLRLQWVEYQMVGFMGQSEIRMSVVEFWEKRLSVSQRRHLRACEALARVRRLLVVKPAVQVNIAAEGGQQVNVAGDVLKK